MDKKKKGKSSKQVPKYLYRYIPFERLAEVLMTKSLPIPYPKNWNDQHDLKNSLRNEQKEDVIGVACLTEKWETSFHWDLFAKYGVRLTFVGEQLRKHAKAAHVKMKNVDYESYKEYIEKLTNNKSLLFVKRKQYEFEQEWRLVCRVPIGQSATKNVVKYIPFEWNDLKKITISPHYSISDYHFYKAMILQMLEAVGAKGVKIMRSSLFESKKITDVETELDFEE